MPVLKVSSVVQNTTVAIQASNLPPNQVFTLRMAPFGNQGIGGVDCGQTKASAGGTIRSNYTIPASLKGTQKIAIRLENNTGNFVAYSWFRNSTSGVPALPLTNKVPTFTIVAVVKDKSVTIRTSDFPAKRDFVVRMGAYGTLGIGGVVVATTNSGGGGSFSATYAIPTGLKGKSRIAIRMDSTSGGYFSYNWFYNASTK